MDPKITRPADVSRGAEVPSGQCLELKDKGCSPLEAYPKVTSWVTFTITEIFITNIQSGAESLNRKR